MTHALVPGSAPEVDVFEDQVFSIYTAIRDAGFLGQIMGPEWTVLDDGREAALVVIEHVNTNSGKSWNVQYTLIRQADDDTVSFFVRPFIGDWRPVGTHLTHFQLYTAVEFETKRAMLTHAPPLRLYYDILAGTEGTDDKIVIFPLEKSYLRAPE